MQSDRQSLRRTKIVATLGPASDDPAVLEAMLLAGADVVRLNFSHGSHADHQQRAAMVRGIAEKHNLIIGILADLQGPKIRVANFVEKKVQLIAGDSFVLDADLDENQGTTERVGIDYKQLPDDVSTDDDAEYTASDSIHPNERGYELWASHIVSAIAAEA